MRHIVMTQGHQDLRHLARHMTQVMEKLLKSGFHPGARAPDWVPAVDVCEMADGYEVIVELAGVRLENIEVYTEHRHLTISGWRGDMLPRDKICLHQMEIEQGRFLRRLALPPDADEEGVTARCREGLLRIRLRKRAP